MKLLVLIALTTCFSAGALQSPAAPRIRSHSPQSMQEWDAAFQLICIAHMKKPCKRVRFSPLKRVIHYHPDAPVTKRRKSSNG